MMITDVHKTRLLGAGVLTLAFNCGTNTHLKPRASPCTRSAPCSRIFPHNRMPRFQKVRFCNTWVSVPWEDHNLSSKRRAFYVNQTSEYKPKTNAKLILGVVSSILSKCVNHQTAPNSEYSLPYILRSQNSLKNSTFHLIEIKFLPP